MKFAINYVVGEHYYPLLDLPGGYSNHRQKVVQVTRIDELDSEIVELEEKHGPGCVKEYFAVPDCAAVTRD